jgi:leucyl aminopeptidase
MKIQFTAKIEASLPAIYFLTEENLSATGALLPKPLAALAKLTKQQAAADETRSYHTGGLTAHFIGLGKIAEVKTEKVRRALHKALARINEEKSTAVQIVFVGLKGRALGTEITQALAEVSRLGTYQFLPYRTERQKLQHKLQRAAIHTDAAGAAAAVVFGANNAEAVAIARDLVNEPPNVLTSVALAKRAQQLARTNGIKATVFDKKKIQSLKMGGLLAVNRGSQTPPTFTILEYKPARAKNKQPIVLVGKGITFDTGGLSLKPTPGSMDSMKSDMAGAAAVIGTMVSLAKNKVNAHVVGLIPSTDNRPGEDAYTPNDVITISNGTTVEVLNTDAEGRLILADALVYAKRYNPKVVIDLATLTGAAVIAVGTIGIAMMATAEDDVRLRIKQSGDRTHERVVELPLWSEYRDQLKSDIADMKNIGGRYAGSITAGKFLEHFTSYPWVHLDIAGPAFLESPDSYRGKNGTGVGVRLLVDFISNL